MSGIIINPYVYSTGESYLLDDYPAGALGAAWSLRLLLSTYTGDCIKVRRSFDNAELDIGFSDGALDEIALVDFVTDEGADLTANGFVTTWYEQSGNTNTVTGDFSLIQTTTSDQPQIVSAGVVEKLNGKPTMSSVSKGNRLHFYNAAGGAWSKENLGGSYPISQPISTFVIGSYYSVPSVQATNPAAMWGTTSGGSGIAVNWSTWSWGLATRTTWTAPGPTWLVEGNQMLLSGFFNTTDSYLYHNGVVDATMNGIDVGTGTWTYMSVFDYYGTRGNWRGKIQEFIIYDDDAISDRVGIETNVNDFYTIY